MRRRNLIKSLLAIAPIALLARTAKAANPPPTLPANDEEFDARVREIATNLLQVGSLSFIRTEQVLVQSFEEQSAFPFPLINIQPASIDMNGGSITNQGRE